MVHETWALRKVKKPALKIETKQKKQKTKKKRQDCINRNSFGLVLYAFLFMTAPIHFCAHNHECFV